MKPLILLFFLCVRSFFLYGQGEVEYIHDAVGQRVKRNVIMMSKGAQMSFSDEAFSVNERIGNFQIQIFPNPTEGILKIHIVGVSTENKVVVFLFDVNGKQIRRREIFTGSDIMDISGELNGLYTLKISIDGEVSSWKVIKE